MVSKKEVAKWAFWIGILWFIASAPTTTLAQPIGFFFPLIFSVPYVYIQLKAGIRDSKAAEAST